jgi:fatty-acyl-CoA synthase
MSPVMRGGPMADEDVERLELRSARRMSHAEQLARTARRSPDVVAFRFQGIDRTFNELDERVSRLAGALGARGVRPGDRVATLMTNRLEVVETYLASSRLGAICVPINFRLVADEVAYIAQDSGAMALVVDEQLTAVARGARERADNVTTCFVTAGDPLAAGAGAEDYESALAVADGPPTVDVSEHDAAFIMYTSGTTGRPKGAVLSHFNLLMNTMNMIAGMGFPDDDRRWLSGLPLFHIGGLNGILPYLLLGGTSVILPSGQFDANEVVDLLERERISACYFVPTQWQAICAVPDIASRDLSALRRISWGASVAPPSVLQAMAEAFPGVPNYNAFGQTEMSSVTCVLKGEDAIAKMGSVGTPIVNVEVAVVDDDMKPVAQGDVGEIVYRGPTVMQGYWNKPEATEEAFRGGWFHSGDLVREDEDGFYYVVDRKKDMIISGGENIYCAEVEAVIDGHPGVREVAVIGKSDPKWVEVPVAIVVPNDPDAPPTTEEIVEWCRARMASYKKPADVVIVEAMPRNASGKILKTQLRSQLGVTRES